MGFAQEWVCIDSISGTVYAPTEKVNLFSIGYNSLLDTYLSPEHYSGFELRYIREETKNTSYVLSHTWTMQGMVSDTEPRSEKASDLSAMANLSFGMHYHFRNITNLDIAFGGQAELFAGGTYNTRNGNNPAQLHAGFDIAPSVRAAYGFRLFRKDMQLKYVASLPLVGIQFSPAYGQSYYEIFSEGNYDHNICFCSPANALSYTQRLTLDIPFKRFALTFGYLGDYRQAEMNSLKKHYFTHSFVIGWTL